MSQEKNTQTELELDVETVKEPSVREATPGELAQHQANLRAQDLQDKNDVLQLSQILNNYRGQLSPRIQGILSSSIINILSPTK